MKITKMLLGALATLSLVSESSAGTEPGRVWTHNSLSGTSYATQASIGDRGGQVFTLIPGIGGKVRLISGATVQGGETVWEAAQGYQVYSGKLASASAAPVHAVLSLEQTQAGGATQAVVRVYGNTSTPLFTNVLVGQNAANLYCGLHVSDDGTRVVAWSYDSPTASVRLRDLDPQNQTVRANRSLPFSMPPVQSRATKNAELAFFTGAGVDGAINVATGEVLLNTPVNGGTGARNDLSRDDGKIYAGVRMFGTYCSVQVYRRHNLPGATFTHSIWFSQDYSVDLNANNCAVSPDGSRLAVAYCSSQLTGALGVDIYDLTQESHPRIARVQPFAQAPTFAYVTNMVFADNGTVICSATQSGGNPELFALQQSGNTWNVSFQAEAGSAALCLGSELWGRACAAFYRPASGNLPAAAEVLLLDTAARNLELRSVPHANASADLRLYASPGSRAQLLQSTYLSPNPITFNNIGTLYVGSSGLIRVPVGIVPSTGFIDLQLPLPSQPGQTRYLQSFATNPRQLGSSALQVTTVP